MQTFTFAALSDQEAWPVLRLGAAADAHLDRDAPRLLSKTLENAVAVGSHELYAEAVDGVRALREWLLPRTDAAFWRAMLPDDPAASVRDPDEMAAEWAAHTQATLRDADAALTVLLRAAAATTPRPDRDAVPDTIGPDRAPVAPAAAFDPDNE